MNKELIEILRELEKKRIPEICSFRYCAGVACAHCLASTGRFNNLKYNSYLETIFSISL